MQQQGLRDWQRWQLREDEASQAPRDHQGVEASTKQSANRGTTEEVEVETHADDEQSPPPVEAACRVDREWRVDVEPHVKATGGVNIEQSSPRAKTVRGVDVERSSLRTETTRGVGVEQTPPPQAVAIVGHSLGGGTAALLTYILREHTEFSTTTCVAFAPASCMTWELAESGKHFVTTIVNGADLVPTVSTASIDDLRSEVTASSWLNDLRDQIQQTRFLNAVYRSATALGTRLQSFSGARARVAGAGALLRPVSSKTLVTYLYRRPEGPGQSVGSGVTRRLARLVLQVAKAPGPAGISSRLHRLVWRLAWRLRGISGTKVVMKQAQNVAQAVARSRSALSSWACMGARRRPVGVIAVSQDEMTAETHVKTTVDSESFVVEQHVTKVVEELQYAATSISVHEETEEEALMSEHETSREHAEEEITDGELWFEFDKDRDRQAEVEARTREEEAAAAKEIMEEESAVLKNVEDRQSFSSDSLERQQFYPPGRIMHMVAMPPPDAGPDDPIVTDECTVGLYGTPRHLYSKIRLSNTMINDHYMPMYKKMMEILIEKFANNDDNSGADSTVE
uniref:Sn1-specific diacylglycerol lipase alpha n=1 Tax=Aegilops tauschii TaxID=37682 RepID=R7W5V8_AEGTA